MHCARPIWIDIGRPIRDPRTGGLKTKMQVPCGQCMCCRIRRRAEWTVRLFYELEQWDKACFVTLTYSDEHLPPNGSLCKRDLQLFHKRLRKEYPSNNLKYYAVGEYGEKTNRPHYHAIYFGLPVTCHGIMAKHWFDDCQIKCGTVTYDSIQYVAGYIEKKLTGELGKEAYCQTGRESPFSVMSRGLGLGFALDNVDRLINDGKLTINGKDVGIPLYFKRKLNLEADKTLSLKREAEIRRRFTANRQIDVYDIGNTINKHRETTEIARCANKRDIVDPYDAF